MHTGLLCLWRAYLPPETQNAETNNLDKINRKASTVPQQSHTYDLPITYTAYQLTQKKDRPNYMSVSFMFSQELHALKV